MYSIYLVLVSFLWPFVLLYLKNLVYIGTFVYTLMQALFSRTSYRDLIFVFLFVLVASLDVLVFTLLHSFHFTGFISVLLSLAFMDFLTHSYACSTVE